MLLKIVTNHLKLINYIKRFRENTLQSMHIRNKTDSSKYLWAIMRSYIGNRHFSLEAITSWPQAMLVNPVCCCIHKSQLKLITCNVNQIQKCCHLVRA